MQNSTRLVHGATAVYLLGCLVLAGLTAAALSPPSAAQDTRRVPAKEEAARKAFLEQDKPGPEAKVLGWDGCVDCHEEVVKVFRASRHTIHLHRQLKKDEHACEYCHGPGSDHVESGDGSKILRFPPRSAMTVKRTVEYCVHCHPSTVDKAHWIGTVHAQADVSCVDCHRFHGSDDDPFMLVKPIARVGSVPGFRYDPKHPTTNQAINGSCLNCHAAHAAQLRMRSRHPLFEDRMSCTDCHEVHRSADPMLMPATKDVSTVCFDCHTDKRGPFVYEHESVHSGGVGEGCMSCHRPHGSPNPKLLNVNGRAACIQCHSDINLDPAHQGRPGNCWRSGCHTAIHGSNVSQYFLR